MRFFLGTHMPNWLATASVPLFVSDVRLRHRKTLPRAAAPWALDSGGFSALSAPPHAWTFGPAEYAERVDRYQREIGQLAWAAPMDHMCEPWILEQTGRTVREHQELTVQNLLDLRAIGGPFIPVLQGWKLEDYVRCAGLYGQAGVDLTAEPVVGVGSVCRRQGIGEAEQIMRELAGGGLRLHGFGVKITGLRRYRAQLVSADSMAWSYDARRAAPLPGHQHKNCANCLDYALAWRERVLSTTEGSASCAYSPRA